MKNSVLKSMLVPLALASVGTPAYSQSKMNVLFISVDDMNNDLASQCKLAYYAALCVAMYNDKF